MKYEMRERTEDLFYVQTIEHVFFVYFVFREVCVCFEVLL